MVKKCFDVGLMPQVKGSKLLHHVFRVRRGLLDVPFLPFLKFSGIPMSVPFLFTFCQVQFTHLGCQFIVPLQESAASKR